MSILQADGIQFGSDSTTLDSLYGIIPQNSVTIFFESSAPTGWTKLTTHDNKALRVVSGTGGGFGSGGNSGPGGNPFTNTFSLVPITGTVTTSGTVGGHTLSIAELPSHSHAAGSAIGINPQPGSGVNGRDTNTSGPVTSSVGGGSAHTHPFTGSPSPWSAFIDMNVQYVDVIVCRFN